MVINSWPQPYQMAKSKCVMLVMYVLLDGGGGGDVQNMFQLYDPYDGDNDTKNVLVLQTCRICLSSSPGVVYAGCSDGSLLLLDTSVI